MWLVGVELGRPQLRRQRRRTMPLGCPRTDTINPPCPPLLAVGNSPMQAALAQRTSRAHKWLTCATGRSRTASAQPRCSQAHPQQQQDQILTRVLQHRRLGLCPSCGAATPPYGRTLTSSPREATETRTAERWTATPPCESAFVPTAPVHSLTRTCGDAVRFVSACSHA